MEKLTIQEKLEVIKEEKFKRSLQRIYDQLAAITQEEIDLNVEEFLEIYKFANKGE
jgi:hypothetical protein